MSKRRSSLVAENPFSGPLPEPEVLASLAAQPRFGEMESRQAVASALALWKAVRAEPSVTTPCELREIATAAAQVRFGLLSEKKAVCVALQLYADARAVIEAEHKLADLYCEQVLKPMEKAEQPQAWPASFDDFLRLAIRGKDNSERLSRFKRFLVFNLQLNDWRERKDAAVRELQTKLGREPLEIEIAASAPEFGDDATIESLPSVDFYDNRIEVSLKRYRRQRFTKAAWKTLSEKFWIWMKKQTSEGRSRRAKAKKPKTKI